MEKVIEHLNNLDYYKEAVELGKKQVKAINTFYDYKIKYHSGGSTHYSNVFGKFVSPNFDNKTFIPKNQLGSRDLGCRIEVIGMKPNYTKDGKYKYDGITLKELKAMCKMNNLKCVVKKPSKVDYVKLLMSI